ncbi:MAG TPA: nucleoside monophosphate kinase [Candidatus Paceibacterota bacterium]|nr:nucleoside monophosphate kinase [Candidatus Paceibacterota bacterium]
MKPTTVLFFGKSGSGKGTQAALLLKTFEREDAVNKVVYVETGQKFRNLTQTSQSFIAKKTLETMSAGKFMPTFMPIWTWTSLLVDELKTGREHIVCDGVCRQPEEAPILDEALQFLDRGKPVIILLDTHHEEVTKRLLKRGRFDDKEEKIAERLREYENRAVPVVNYFKKSPNVKFVTVDGNQTIEKVHEDVLRAIGIDGRL